MNKQKVHDRKHHVRFTGNQYERLRGEQQARGVSFADCVRTNLELAFAVKDELAGVCDGQYLAEDAAAAPRLVHSLLFQTEERLVSTMDTLRAELKEELEKLSANGEAKSPETVGGQLSMAISKLSSREDITPETWLGALIEIVPRVEGLDEERLRHLREKAEGFLLREVE